jgi:hypothetical protein
MCHCKIDRRYSLEILQMELAVESRLGSGRDPELLCNPLHDRAHQVDCLDLQSLRFTQKMIMQQRIYQGMNNQGVYPLSLRQRICDLFRMAHMSDSGHPDGPIGKLSQ